MRPLTIGVDAACWSNRRGFGRFTRCLLGELVPRAVERGHRIVLVADERTLEDPSLPPMAEVRSVRVGVPAAEAAAAGGSRSVRDMLITARVASRIRADVFFFPATYTYVPVLGTKVVVTAHDAIAEKLPDLIVPRRADRWRWEAKQRLALRHAKVVVTVSEAARDEVIHVLDVDPSRVEVVNEGAHPRFVPRAHGSSAPVSPAPCPYFLYVGGFSPHKNIVTLVRSFDRVAERHPSAHLVLAGDIDEDPFLSSAADVRRAISALRRPEAVRISGFVSDDDLVELYRGAVATVLISRGEGFGLPVAESMACGTPVVVTDAPALHETAGDAGLFVDPDDEADIADAMQRLLTDETLRRRLAASGLRRTEERSWDRAALTVLGILERVARS